MRIRTAEKERVLHRIDTSLFSTLEDRVCEKVLQTSEGRLIGNKDPLDVQTSLVRFVRILSYKIVTISENSTHVAYLAHAVGLNFTKKYNTSRT